MWLEDVFEQFFSKSVKPKLKTSVFEIFIKMKKID